MEERRPKAKGAASLVVAVLLLGPGLFFWWRLVYLYDLGEGGAAIAWATESFGPLTLDANSEKAQLAYNMGRLPEARRFMNMPFNDPDLFIILFWVMVGWGAVQLYLAWYYFRQKSPKHTRNLR